MTCWPQTQSATIESSDNKIECSERDSCSCQAKCFLAQTFDTGMLIHATMPKLWLTRDISWVIQLAIQTVGLPRMNECCNESKNVLKTILYVGSDLLSILCSTIVYFAKVNKTIR